MKAIDVGLFFSCMSGNKVYVHSEYCVFTEVCKQNKLIQEKKDNLLKLIAEVKGKTQEMEVLTANIQDLKEEYSRKRESKFPVINILTT